MKTVIHWFRRDLRVSDNTALNAAATRGQRVIPVFILEEAFKTGPDVGAARTAFLLQAVDALRKELASLGYPLVIRVGRSVELIPTLAAELKAEAVFANRRYEPYALARDQKIFNSLNQAGVGFEVFKDAVVWEERDVLTKSGHPYTVFTPYAKAWRSRKVLSPFPVLVPSASKVRSVRSDPLPLDPAEIGHPVTHKIPPSGERVALDALDRFLSGPVFEYAARRNNPAEEGTSRLSAHLRCGTLGIRTVYSRLQKVRENATPEQKRNCDVWLSELIWREFYLQILANFPHVMHGPFRPEYEELRWQGSDEQFEAWCAGMTGYPIVDAAMRCLNATGTMHNRLRMIVAMFLCKDLLIDWRRGERYFMQRLLDGDMAANNGGWQWSAGTGTDAAPYFRIFNPVSQGEKFDPEGTFVRRWVPEFDAIPSELIHRPWESSRAKGTKYLQRIVLHEEQRPKCLAMFKAVRKRALKK